LSSLGDILERRKGDYVGKGEESGKERYIDITNGNDPV
jgi:hypothetical protein